jgi:hypothetical protein
MTSFGQIKLATVWKMLKKCAPGHARIELGHHWRIDFGDRSYPAFPLGKRRSKTPEVQLGHVRKMVRHLGIEECAKAVLRQL